MKRIKKLVLQLLHPGAVWTILITVASTAALVFVFMNGLDTSPVGYAVYILSAYAVAVLVFALPRIVKRVKAVLYGNKYSKRYITDMPFRTRISLYVSLFINLLYAMFQLAIGLYYASVWYGAVAVYYIVICAVSFLLLYYFRKSVKELKQELKAYRFCGLLLFALNITMVGMVIQMVRDGQGARYPGLMIYTMAAYAFYRITLSIINVVKYRKMKSPVLSASKALNLATALMAMFSLETAMIAEFGGTETFGLIMNTATGACVCIFILCMAIFMVRRANKELKALQINNSQT